MANASSKIKKAFFVVLVILGGAAALWLDYGDDAEVFQAEAPKPTTDLTKMTMAQAITHCRALWTAGHYDQDRKSVV